MCPRHSSTGCASGATPRPAHNRGRQPQRAPIRGTLAALASPNRPAPQARVSRLRSASGAGASRRRSGSWLRPRWRVGQGSRRPGLRAALASAEFGSIESQEKPPVSGGFSGSALAADGLGISLRLAGHREIALLNDALLRRLFRAGSGRIAQLVEQMTLNHRVPGSSPGAPTRLSSTWQ